MTNIYIPYRDEVVNIPTRKELHDLVDSEFFALYPETPAALDRTGQADAEWRRIWREIRDHVLNRETDRVFHAMFSEAPRRLDPDDPEYAPHWHSIRDGIDSRAPEPDSDNDESVSDTADYSYLRAELYADLDRATIHDRPEVVAQVRTLIDDAIEAIHVEVDEGWTADRGDAISETRELERSSGSIIRVTVTVWWSHETLHGRLEIDLAPFAG